MKSFISIFLASLLSLAVFAQKKVSVKISLPTHIDFDKLNVTFNNGVDSKNITSLINNGVIEFNDSIRSRYGTLYFSYPDSSETEGIPVYFYWIWDKPAEIDFNIKHENANPFRKAKLNNALSVYDKGYSQYLQFIEKENLDTKGFYLKNMMNFSSSPELFDTFINMREAVTKKSVEFIQFHASDYFSLWLFNMDFAQSRQLDADFAFEFYNQVFPDSLRNTFEGKEALEKINARLSTKMGTEAPNFVSYDTEGKKIQLSDFYGKYVLLDFWASWCGPCIKMMPELKKLRSQFPKEDLEFISISIDENKSAFESALIKLDTHWTHIHDTGFSKSYSIGPIPQLILIDSYGTIVYNREEQGHNSIKELQSLLEDIFENR